MKRNPRKRTKTPAELCGEMISMHRKIDRLLEWLSWHRDRSKDDGFVYDMEYAIDKLGDAQLQIYCAARQLEDKYKGED